MAVIINDFEIVVQQPDEEPTPGADDLPAPSPELRPMDLFDTLRFRDEREERLWAH